ncbi:MAG: hypothetical protein Q4G07_04255, partial [Oscillospiraceae bacterium]|nr:hypothetical protein [Oscillospiraceae bacterium]
MTNNNYCRIFITTIVIICGIGEKMDKFVRSKCPKRSAWRGTFCGALWKMKKEKRKNGGNIRRAAAATLLLFSTLLVWCWARP